MQLIMFVSERPQCECFTCQLYVLVGPLADALQCQLDKLQGQQAHRDDLIYTLQLFQSHLAVENLLRFVKDYNMLEKIIMQFTARPLPQL